MIYAIILGLTFIVGSLFKQYWIGMGVGLAIDLIVFFWIKYRSIFKKRPAEKKVEATKPAGATPAAAGAPAPAKSTHPAIKLAAVLAFIGLCVGSWFLVDFAQYQKRVDVVFTSLEDQKICHLGLKPGTYYMTFPRQAVLAHPYNNRNGKNDRELGFRVQYRNGEMGTISYLKEVRINDTHVGFSEQVVIEDDHCFTVSVPGIPKGKRLGAILYGTVCPIENRSDRCYPSEAEPPKVTVLFSRAKFIAPVMN